MSLKRFYSAVELVDLKLPSLPTARGSIHRRAIKEEWPYQDVPGGGGHGGFRREFKVPSYVLAEIMAKEGMTPEESLKALDDYLARADTETPFSEQNIIRILHGKAVEEPEIWAICAGAVKMFGKMYNVSMTPEQEHHVTEASYCFMLARKRMGKSAEIGDLAGVIKTMVA